MSQANNLNSSTRWMHWLVAIFIIGLVSAGLIMSTFELYFMYPIHQSLGILALLVIVPRVIMRLVQGWPTPIRRYEAKEIILSKVIHWVLLLATLAMPISGMINNWAGGWGLDIFGLQLAQAYPDPNNPEEMLVQNATLANLASMVHEYLGYILAAAIVLHVAGALKHHLVDKDRTLLRMLGR